MNHVTCPLCFMPYRPYIFAKHFKHFRTPSCHTEPFSWSLKKFTLNPHSRARISYARTSCLSDGKPKKTTERKHFDIVQKFQAWLLALSLSLTLCRAWLLAVKKCHTIYELSFSIHILKTYWYKLANVSTRIGVLKSGVLCPDHYWSTVMATSRLLKEKKCLVVVVTPSSAPHVPYKYSQNQLSNLLRRSPYFGMDAGGMHVYILIKTQTNVDINPITSNYIKYR